MAVNVTGDPAQILFDGVAILTKGAAGAMTLMVILLLVALAGVVHALLEVIIQLTISPFVSVLLINVALFVPALLPLSNHL